MGFFTKIHIFSCCTVVSHFNTVPQVMVLIIRLLILISHLYVSMCFMLIQYIEMVANSIELPCHIVIKSIRMHMLTYMVLFDYKPFHSYFVRESFKIITRPKVKVLWKISSSNFVSFSCYDILSVFEWTLQLNLLESQNITSLPESGVTPQEDPFLGVIETQTSISP